VDEYDAASQMLNAPIEMVSPVKIEIIAARGVRDALGIDDGDSLRLEIQS
jgi:CTP-dependent riboflavin kinase